MRAAVTSAGAPPAPGEAIARRPPLKPMSTTSTRRSSVSASAAAPRAIARRASSRGARTSSSSSRSADPGGSPAAADGASRTSPWRSPSVVSKRGELLRHRAGEEDRQLRAANRGGGDERGDVLDPAALVGSGRLTRADEHGVDRRVEDGGGHRERVHRVGADRADAPAGPPGRVGERRDGPIRGGDGDESLGRHAPGDQAGQRRGGPAAVVAERPGQLRVGRLGPLQQQADDRVGVDRRGHRQGADQAPAMADSCDQRGRGGGSPEVEGEEGSGIGHSVIVPAWSPH